ncbi:cation:proton antiporter [Phycisphaerales bacterium AB-hyl4]|uniref:Cation:proton antiporter n=1 Tax=Natronomicrosphaera hydrolytica TaxID=3242702 RepID=A0ABV4UAJ9_9BACT
MNAIRNWYQDVSDAHLPITDPVLIFALVMILILLGPAAARRLGMPGLVGLIIGGAIVGEAGLGLIARPGTMELLGTVGLLYLMFAAGLGLDLAQFSRQRNRSVIFGLVSFFIPQIMGVLAGVYLLGFDLIPAVLLGSIVGSHTLLALPIAKRIGIARNTAITMATGGTIVTDALSLTVLAVVAALAAGEMTAMFWITFPLMVGAYAASIIIGLPIIGRWFYRSVQREANTEFVFLLVVLFISAALSDAVGLAPIVGAFLAGLVMNRLVPDTGPLMNRVHFVGEALFIPFFLLAVGMLVDFRVLVSWNVWWLALVFTSLVFVGKGGSALLVARLFKNTREEGWAIAGLSIPQAAATLAVTLVGYRLELFTSEVVNAVVVMMLLTCLVGPWLVERFGRQVALQEEKAPYRPTDAPQRMLVPLGNPATADALMDLAFSIRDQDSHEPVYPLTVARDDGQVEAHVAAGEKMLGHAVIHAAGASVPVIPVTRVDINVANGITRAVTELRISNIVVGWNGYGGGRQRIFGGILDQVLQQTQQAVMICRMQRLLNTTEQIVIVVPPLTDRQPGFDVMVRMLKLMAHHISAKLRVVTTEETWTAVRRVFEKGRPEVTVNFEPVSIWSNLLPVLDKTVEEHDILALFSARKGRLAWQPMLDRLPSTFARRFDEQNLLVVYPSEVVVETSSAMASHLDELPLIEALADGRTAFDLDEQNHEAALKQIVDVVFSDDDATRSILTEVLVRNSREFSAEVTPGVVLVHAHVSAVTEPTVLLGISPAGLRFPLVQRPANLVFVLLSPANRSPEQHLKALAEIAKLVRQETTVKRLRNARSADDLRQSLEPANEK